MSKIQSSDWTSVNFVWNKNHNQPTFHETTTIHSVLERWIPTRKQPFCLYWCTCSVVLDGKDLSIFIWSPAVNAVSVITLSWVLSGTTLVVPTGAAAQWLAQLVLWWIAVPTTPAQTASWSIPITTDPSAKACLWTEVLLTNLLLLSLMNKFLSLCCELKSYTRPRLIDCGSSGCNLDFASFNTCHDNIISSRKTKHSSVISIQGGSGR